MPKRGRAAAVESGDASPAADEPAAPSRAAGAAALDPAALAAFSASERARGVVYLSRIPPFMRPVKLRHLLSAYGEIGRIYLAPEDGAAYSRRVKAGGNKRVQFTEGWVEFEDKRVARATARTIHNQRIGDGLGVRGKAKRNFFADDAWNVKYLRGFKWHHLTEKVAYERRVRAARLRASLSSARKDAEAYLARVDQAKGLGEQAARRASAGARVDAGADGADGADADSAALLKNVRRRFKQRAPLPEVGDNVDDA